MATRNVATMPDPDCVRRAARAARSLRAVTAGQPGAGHSVYVVLLRDATMAGRWGLYVGQTARDPDLRFDQHRAGYKSSGAVRRFGVRLVPELVAHLNPMRRWEALEIEAALAEAFRAAGVAWVEGGH
jgi:predicted GIY-YIG superfamily endonuclease